MLPAHSYIFDVLLTFSFFYRLYSLLWAWGGPVWPGVFAVPGFGVTCTTLAVGLGGGLFGQVCLRHRVLVSRAQLSLWAEGGGLFGQVCLLRR